MIHLATFSVTSSLPSLESSYDTGIMLFIMARKVAMMNKKVPAKVLSPDDECSDPSFSLGEPGIKQGHHLVWLK